jgi:putative ABC transport system substrate-binding protein
MMDRRAFVAGTLALVAAPLGIEAQPVPKTARIGILVQRSAPIPRRPFPAIIEPLFEELRNLGWVEGQNLVVEFRGGPDLQALATELVGLQVDVIVAPGTPPALAAKAATRTIPIVFAANDVVEQGLVASHARPGGNLTGVDWQHAEMAPKRLQLLKEAFPRIRRVAFLFPNSPVAQRFLTATQAAARTLNVELQPVDADVDQLSQQLSQAFATITASRAEAVIVISSGPYLAERKRIVELAARHRLPCMFDSREYVDDGGLMAYETPLVDSYRLMAKYVDKILRGAKPADLPVELATKIQLVINLKTAKALGLTIPPTVLARADEIIQ